MKKLVLTITVVLLIGLSGCMPEPKTSRQIQIEKSELREKVKEQADIALRARIKKMANDRLYKGLKVPSSYVFDSITIIDSDETDINKQYYASIYYQAKNSFNALIRGKQTFEFTYNKPTNLLEITYTFKANR